jgi:hypothetical protein
MATQFITVLSVIGVLGTAGTAMAANTDVLTGIDSANTLGQATESILPAGGAVVPTAPAATPAPAVDPSATPGASVATAPTGSTAGNGSAPGAATPARQNSGTAYQAPAQAPVQAPAVQAPAAQVNGTTGGSGARITPVSPSAPQSTSTKKVEQEHEADDDD